MLHTLRYIELHDTTLSCIALHYTLYIYMYLCMHAGSNSCHLGGIAVQRAASIALYVFFHPNVAKHDT